MDDETFVRTFHRTVGGAVAAPTCIANYRELLRATRVPAGAWRISTLTRANPARTMSSRFAAARERSRIRPFTNGPRSFTRTTTDRPFSRFVTRTVVPNGNVRWAAVSFPLSNLSPLAVGRPLYLSA